ncbi:MAG: hypothetical protein ONB30_12790 [candidate division KSB1 bacterium]|nr:hypothetical protein [candidate division KSB1 bacterium]
MYSRAVLAALSLGLVWSLAGQGPCAAQEVDQSRALVALLPGDEEMSGWKRLEPLQFFGPENLWEYIDGAADLYLEYGFQAVVAAEYMTADSARSMTVEIYRMATPLGGFGIYAAERSPEDSIVAIGVQGCLSDNTLKFWKGPYYVKLISFDVETDVPQVLMSAGRLVASRIAGEYAQPRLLACFPEAERVPHSERYIPHHFLGQKYLHNAYRVDYRHGPTGCQLFVVAGDSGKQSLDRFVEFARSQRQKVLVDAIGDVPVVCTGDDRWTILFVHDGLLAGATGVVDLEKGKALVGKLITRLRECWTASGRK